MLGKHTIPPVKTGAKETDMPNIPNVGEVVWTGDNEFSFSSRNELFFDLEREERNMAMGYADSSPKKAAVLTDIAKTFKQEQKKPLRLEIEIRFNPYDFEVSGSQLDNIINGLNQHVSKECVVIMRYRFQTVSLAFFVDEDIRDPSRYLEALAYKMRKWALV